MIHFISRCRAALVAVLAITILQACSSLGLAQPKSFRDSYAYALGQTTALRTTASQALDARLITVADAEYVLKTTDQSRLYLEQSKQIYEAGQSLEGKRQLELATAVLLQLQTYLNARASK